MKCQQCQAVVHGRTDKKFCNDLCRNNFHNDRRRERTDGYRKVVASLQHNRGVLHDLMRQGKTVASLHQLEELGFNGTYHTHTRMIADRQCFYCYEYGYEIVGGDVIRLTALPRELLGKFAAPG